MNDEQLIADLHSRWVFGWERNEGDAPFDFRRTFGEFYDFSSPDVRLYDDFDPEQRVATTAAGYGSIWEPNFHTMVSAHHAVEDGPHVIVGHGLAASTLTFVARITRPDVTTDIRTRTSLVWRRTPDGWRIVREHNSAKILPAGELDDVERPTRASNALLPMSASPLRASAPPRPETALPVNSSMWCFSSSLPMRRPDRGGNVNMSGL